MPEFLSVSEAQQRLLHLLTRNLPKIIPLSQAIHLVLAEDILAPQEVPLFTNSGMDGFAVRSQDAQAIPVKLEIIEDIPAGHYPKQSLGPGQSSRIMTGAPLPDGADAVVPVEETDHNHAQPAAPLPNEVTILAPARVGQYVRYQGQDITRGKLLLEAGRRLTPQDIGLLASCGLAYVPVISRPRVALFSSGDELAVPGDTLLPGQIYDSNQLMISELLREVGAEVISLEIARDNPDDIDRVLNLAVGVSPDIIVSTAGVSVGTFDYIRQRIEATGRLEFWRVNMRPGKPIAYGTYRSIPFVGLPGNPVSAFIGCLVFIIPALRYISGLPPFNQNIISATLMEPIESDGRESYLRAVASQQGEGFMVRLAGHQGSANLYALTQANALLIIPSGVKSLPAGQKVQIWLLTHNGN